MTTNFIYGIIRRSNLNQFILALIGIIVVVVGVVLAKNFYYNFFNGPFETSKQTVLNIDSLDGLSQYFITIKGDDAIDTGFQYVTKNYGIETGHDSYVALALGKKFLLVQVSGDANEATRQYTGALEYISSEVQSKVLNEIIAEVPQVKGRFLPFMLNTSNFQSTGWIGGAAVVILGLISIWLLLRVIQRMSNPAKHPIMRGLARFGDAEGTADMIESEMNEDHQVIDKNTHLTRNWLVYRTGSTLSATKLTDVAWLYKFITQRRTYGIKTGRTFHAYIWDRHGVCIKIPGKEPGVMQTLEGVARRSPWSVIGYKKELEQSWKKDRTGFVAVVDKRRQEMRA